MEFEKHFCEQKISGFCIFFLLANFMLALLSTFSHAQANQHLSSAEKINSANSITLDNIGGGGAILAKINFQIM